MSARNSPRVKSPTSLRQRRSMSPPVDRREMGFDCDPIVNDEAEFLTLSGVGTPSKPKPKPSPTSFSRLVSIRDGNLKARIPFALYLFLVTVAVIVVVPIVVVFVHNVAVSVGYYNAMPTCPATKFDYAWCENSFLHSRELPPPLTGEEWLGFRRLYMQSLSKAGVMDRSSFAEDWEQPNSVGFFLSFPDQLEFRHSLEKGRGIFATAPIKAGTKIWDSRYRAVFPNECAARIFFNQLNNAQKCDAMFWGYINDFYGNGMQYMLDMDGHGYINHVPKGGHNVMHHFDGELDKERYIVSYLSWMGHFFRAKLREDKTIARNKPGAYALYATRDIEAGEELLYDYNEIFMLGWWDWYTIFLENSLPVMQWITL